MVGCLGPGVPVQGGGGLVSYGLSPFLSTIRHHDDDNMNAAAEQD